MRTHLLRAIVLRSTSKWNSL